MEASPEPPAATMRSVTLTALLIGLMLLVAAVLKLEQLGSVPVDESSFWSSRAARIGLAIVELAFGVTLIGRYRLRWTLPLAMIAFAVFWLVASYRIWTGEASCGCFGRVVVPPAVTWVIDAIAIMALYYATVEIWKRPDIDRRSWWVPISIVVLLAVPLGIRAAKFQPLTLDDVGVESGGLILLRPEEWVGAPFALADFIEDGQILKSGKWNVLLFHHDCPKCQQRIRQLTRLTRRPDEPLALIELPPYGPPAAIPNATLLKLSKKQRWFVRTPVELTLETGVVKSLIVE